MCREYTVPTGPISSHIFNRLVDIADISQVLPASHREKLGTLLRDLHEQVDRVVALENTPIDTNHA